MFVVMLHKKLLHYIILNYITLLKIKPTPTTSHNTDATVAFFIAQAFVSVP